MSETSQLLNEKTKVNNIGNTFSDNKGQSKSLLSNCHKTHIYDYLYFICSSICYCIASFSQQSVSPITDVLKRELNITSSGVGLLSSSYYLTYLIFQIPFGIILQHYSHYKLLLIVSISLTIGVTLFGFINTLIFAIILRACTGLFASPLWILTITIIGDHFGNNKVGLFGGITQILTYLFSLFAMTMQGYIYEKYQLWRETYYMLGLFGIINAIAIVLSLLFNSMYSHQTTIDGVINANNDNNTKIELEEVNNSEINVDNKFKIVVSNYLNWCLGFYGFALFAIFTSIFNLWLIPYLMLKFNYSRSLSSFFAGIGSASVGFGAICFGYLSSKFRNRKIYMIIANLLISSLLYLLYLDKEMLNEYAVFVIILMSGFGTGSNVIIYTLSREYNAKSKSEETASGFVNALNVSSGVISQYLTGLLIDYHWRIHNNNNNNNGIREYHVDDYQFAFSCVVPASLIITIISTILLKETNAKNI